eukprot:6212945-Pyramimonas_sp.AAC.1
MAADARDAHQGALHVCHYGGPLGRGASPSGRCRQRRHHLPAGDPPRHPLLTLPFPCGSSVAGSLRAIKSRHASCRAPQEPLEARPLAASAIQG